jgi:hypothetical protein
MDIPSVFTTMRGEEGGANHPIVPRQHLDAAVVAALLGQLSDIQWPDVYHAYGPASDVPGQLAAVIVGDDQTRGEAWWNLWGNIHHQGTIYEATVAAVPILLGLAGWPDHPDRAQALLMLREVGAAAGVYVWRYGADDELVSNEEEQQRLYPELRNMLAAGAAPMLERWRSEPPDVQRALLWLLSALPDLRADHEDLIEENLPERHRRGWELEIADSVDSQEEADAVCALEDWVHSGADS